MAEIRQELLDELLADYESRDDLVGPDGLIKQLFRRLIETAAGAELTDHLGYERGDPAGRGSGNSRNGTTPKTLLTEFGEVPVEVPRDRNSSFDPQIVAKGQTHWDGFDDKIISMYAGGMTYEEIRGHLAEIYDVDVSKDFITTVTDKVLDDVRAWQNRPLDDCYLVVWIDALVVKVRVDGVVRNRPAYLVLGLNMEGKKEALALVIGTGDESAKFWLKMPCVTVRFRRSLMSPANSCAWRSRSAARTVERSDHEPHEPRLLRLEIVAVGLCGELLER